MYTCDSSCTVRRKRFPRDSLFLLVAGTAHSRSFPDSTRSSANNLQTVAIRNIGSLASRLGLGVGLVPGPQ
jgi:hypothetical protein